MPSFYRCPGVSHSGQERRNTSRIRTARRRSHGHGIKKVWSWLAAPNELSTNLNKSCLGRDTLSSILRLPRLGQPRRGLLALCSGLYTSALLWYAHSSPDVTVVIEMSIDIVDYSACLAPTTTTRNRVNDYVEGFPCVKRFPFSQRGGKNLPW